MSRGGCALRAHFRAFVEGEGAVGRVHPCRRRLHRCPVGGDAGAGGIREEPGRDPRAPGRDRTLRGVSPGAGPGRRGTVRSGRADGEVGGRTVGGGDPVGGGGLPPGASEAAHPAAGDPGDVDPVAAAGEEGAVRRGGRADGDPDLDGGACPPAGRPLPADEDPPGPETFRHPRGGPSGQAPRKEVVAVSMVVAGFSSAPLDEKSPGRGEE